MQGGRCRILVIEDDRETADQIVEVRRSTSREQYLLRKCVLNAAHVLGALADPLVKPARRSDESRRPLIASNT
jgi:hypothetical protein